MLYISFQCQQYIYGPTMLLDVFVVAPVLIGVYAVTIVAYAKHTNPQQNPAQTVAKLKIERKLTAIGLCVSGVYLAFCANFLATFSLNLYGPIFAFLTMFLTDVFNICNLYFLLAFSTDVRTEYVSFLRAWVTSSQHSQTSVMALQ